MKTSLILLAHDKAARSTLKTGNQSVDNFFHNLSSQLDKDNQVKTYVLETNPTGNLVGFFSTNMTVLERQRLPQNFVKKGLPNSEIPLLRLCYIGISQEFQGQGFGTKLLGLVMLHVHEVSLITGCAGIILDVVEDGRAAKIRWYQSLGFELLAGSDKTMVLSIRSVLRSLEGFEK
jgi:ribosomal protein S18 acetylase RimI-like enzyme